MITALPIPDEPDIPILSGVLWEQWERADKAKDKTLAGCLAWMGASA